MKDRGSDDEAPQWTEEHFARAIPVGVRRRLKRGQLESGDDIMALRRFINLTQSEFATAMGISVRTLRSWEQGRRKPKGPALALLRIAAKHPGIIRRSLDSVA